MSTTKGSSKSGAGSAQLKQLKATVEQLRKRLASEAKKRQLDLDVVKQAKRARDEVTKQVDELRKRGTRMANELRKALLESERARKAREDALSRITELKAELVRRTKEVRMKSAELATLARQSAERAREIIQSEPQQEKEEREAVSSNSNPDRNDFDR
jgi:chromosome segregation ATPase